MPKIIGNGFNRLFEIEEKWWDAEVPPTLVISQVNLTGGRAVSEDHYQGGAIYIKDGGKFVAINSAIWGNFARRGGGIMAGTFDEEDEGLSNSNTEFPAIIQLINTTLAFNRAGIFDMFGKRGKGGGIYARKAEMSIIGGNVIYNSACNQGGGIYVTGSPELYRDGEGTRIFFFVDDLSRPSISLNNVNVKFNEAVYAGSGMTLHSPKGNITLINTSIESNRIMNEGTVYGCCEYPGFSCRFSASTLSGASPFTSGPRIWQGGALAIYTTKIITIDIRHSSIRFNENKNGGEFSRSGHWNAQAPLEHPSAIYIGNDIYCRFPAKEFDDLYPKINFDWYRSSKIFFYNTSIYSNENSSSTFPAVKIAPCNDFVVNFVFTNWGCNNINVSMISKEPEDITSGMSPAAQEQLAKSMHLVTQFQQPLTCLNDPGQCNIPPYYVCKQQNGTSLPCEKLLTCNSGGTEIGCPGGWCSEMNTIPILPTASIGTECFDTLAPVITSITSINCTDNLDPHHLKGCPVIGTIHVAIQGVNFQIDNTMPPTVTFNNNDVACQVHVWSDTFINCTIFNLNVGTFEVVVKSNNRSNIDSQHASGDIAYGASNDLISSSLPAVEHIRSKEPSGKRGSVNVPQQQIVWD
eukprot:g7330.t1